MNKIPLEQAAYWSQLNKICCSMRLRGIAIDMVKLEEVIKQMIPEVEKLRNDLSISLQCLDIDKPAQLKEALIKLGYKLPKTEKGNDSVNGKWLDSMKGDTICDTIDEYRSTKKLLNDFLIKIKNDMQYTCPEALLPGAKVGRIYPSLNVFGAKASGRMSSNSPNVQQIPKHHPKYGKLIRSIFISDKNNWYSLDWCYDDQTEILTNKGFILFKDLNKSIHQVAQVNNDKIITYIRPTKIIRLDYTGEMYNQIGKWIDINVSPNHDLLFEKNDRFIKIKAKNAEIRGMKNVHAGLKVKGIEWPLIRLAAAVQADGKIKKNKSGKVTNIVFKFKKQRKVDRLKNLLDEYNIPYNENTPPSWNKLGFKAITILQHVGIENIAIKQWPELREFSLNTRNNLLDEIVHWDGDQVGEYFTSNKQNAEQINIACILSGRRSRLIQRKNTCGFSKNPQYTVIMFDEDYSWSCSNKYEETYYSGKIYCVTVPEGKIVVRRNGKVSIGSNCNQEGRLQVCAGISLNAPGIKQWEEAYNNNPLLDQHGMTGELCKIERTPAKAINLGISYGMQSAALARSLGLPTEKRVSKNGYPYEIAGKEAQKILDRYHEGVPYIKFLIEYCRKAMEKHGHITTIDGRRLQKDLYGRDYVAVSKFIQGSGFDLMAKALKEAYSKRLDLIISLHDEICIEGTIDNAKELCYIMENTHKDRLKIPMKVEVKEGKNWGEGEKIKI